MQTQCIIYSYVDSNNADFDTTCRYVRHGIYYANGDSKLN